MLKKRIFGLLGAWLVLSLAVIAGVLYFFKIDKTMTLTELMLIELFAAAYYIAYRLDMIWEFLQEIKQMRMEKIE